MADEEVDELRRLTAQMYRMLEHSEDVDECLEPMGLDDACPPRGCSDCGWHQTPLRDSLLQLGVPI